MSRTRLLRVSVTLRISPQTIACGQRAARKNGTQNAAVRNKDCVVLEIYDEHEIHETGFGGAALLFAGAVHCGGGVLRFAKPVRRTVICFGWQTVGEGFAATSGADRVVPGCAGCSDSCGFDVSNADRRGGSLDAE